MLNRRTLFGASAAAASFLASSLTGSRAVAGIRNPVDVEPRGTTGRLERLPRLDLESLEDFHTSFRTWVNRDLSRATEAHCEKVLAANGFTPESDITVKQALDILGDDPMVGTRLRTWTTTQEMMWRNLLDEFHGNADAYLAEMEEADNAGPGTLELNPDMDMPDYTKHEIHNQPGGYVGDPFAGYVYHYGTNNFFMGRNYQDELHLGMARLMPGPIEGSINRILDLGCSCGQMTVGLKERFPEAEVWGIDVGGPMVRYAHMRARDLGVDVNFAQRLAEDTKFPDNHFDIVTSYILHHELTEEASQQVIQEAYRILRPGGIFFPIDFYTGDRSRPKTGWEQVRYWWTHRWNVEVWYYQYEGLDFPGEMKKAGFDVNENGPAARSGQPYNLLGVKPV